MTEYEILKCSVYLIKYITEKKEEYFKKFNKMFKRFKSDEKMQSMCYVRNYLIQKGIIKKQIDDNKINEKANRTLIKELGIPYDIFEQLDFEKQQQLIEEHRKKKKSKSDMVKVMIGNKENTIFVKKRRGKKYMLSDGTFVRVGDTPEEFRERIESQLDNTTNNKTVSFIKKLSRTIKK